MRILYWGKITISLFKEFLEAINYFIENDVHYVDVKRIRRFNNVKSSDRSRITFYFRFLNYLEENGLIVLINENSFRPKRYKLPETKIEINQFIIGM